MSLSSVLLINLITGFPINHSNTLRNPSFLFRVADNPKTKGEQVLINA